MTPILHLAPRARFEAWPADAPYAPEGLPHEGFCHMSPDDATMLAVANAFYRDDPQPFVMLVVDPAALTSPVVWEAAVHPADVESPPDAPRFPHVYGPLDRAAISAVLPVRRAADGSFVGW